MTQGVLPKDLGQFAGEPRIDTPKEPVVAPGDDAPRAFAVQYQGPWETEFDGVARAVRKHARALSDAGLPVLLQSFNHMVQDRQGGHHMANLGSVEEAVLGEVGSMLTTRASLLSPRIKHLVAMNVDQLLRALLPTSLLMGFEDPEAELALRRTLLGSSITYTVWERDTVPRDIAKVLSQCGDNWVPSEANARALRNSGVPEDRVAVVPHPVFEADPLWKLRLRRGLPHLPEPWEGLKTTSKRFYTISKWEPRKALDRVMHAFLLAFSPGDDATLLIKTGSQSWTGFTTPEEALTAALDDPRVKANGWDLPSMSGHCVFILGSLVEKKIHEIHFRSTHYVSASHAEGFGLGAFEATIAGNHVVRIDGQGGVEDFTRDSGIVVPSRDAPCDASYGWNDDAVWRDYSVDDLAEAMRAAPSGILDRPEDLASFMAPAVGKVMRERVLCVAAGLPGCREALLT